MTYINLLPWRETLREEKRKQFITWLIIWALITIIILMIIGQYMNFSINKQNNRNEFLIKELNLLDQDIKKISELKASRQKLLKRMKVIRKLQNNRLVIIRLFDQLARRVPNGIHFTHIAKNNRQIAITGFAEAHGQVATLMRNLEESPWFESANLLDIKAHKALNSDTHDVSDSHLDMFQLTIYEVQPNTHLK